MTGLLTWIAGGSIGLIATIALAFTSATSTSVNNLSDKVSSHDTSIELLKQSACIQSQNMVNIGRKLQVDIVIDPNCIK